MATYEEVINGNINSLKELKDLVKSFKDELATAKEGTQEWEDACEGLAVAQDRVNKINQAAKGNLDELNGATKDSINALKERIKQLNAERNAMDMNSQEYADATVELKALNDQLRNSGVAAGDMKANVGNYAESLQSSFEGVGDAVKKSSNEIIGAVNGLGTSLGGLSPTMKTATSSLKALKAAGGEIGIVIAAIVALLTAFNSGVNSSEENTKKFQEALLPLKKLLTYIQEQINKATTAVLDWMIAIQKNEGVMKVFRTVLQAIITAFLLMKERIRNMVEVYQKWYAKLKEIAGKIKDVFNPVIQAINKVYNKVVGYLRPVMEWIVDKYNWLARSDLGKLFGLHTIEGVGDAWKKAGDIVSDIDGTIVDTASHVGGAITTTKEYSEELAKLLRDNADLTTQIAAKEREIAEEREKAVIDYTRLLELQNEKNEMALQIAKNNLAIRQAEYDAIVARNAALRESQRDMQAENQAAIALEEAQRALTAAEYDAAQALEKIQKEAAQKNYTDSLNTLTKALKDLDAQYAKTAETIKDPIAPEGRLLNQDSINTYYDSLKAKYQADYEAYEAMIDGKIALLEQFIATQKAAGFDVTQQEEELAELRAKNAKAYENMLNSQKAADSARNKAIIANYRAELNAYANLVDSMSKLFEENTLAYKVTATAKALIDTYLAATAVLAEQQGGVAARVAAMAATIAAGVANVIKIWKTDVKNPDISEATTTTATATPRVDDTPYSYARTIQTAAAEETLNQGSQPLKVYVLESDITKAQNKARVRVAESSF